MDQVKIGAFIAGLRKEQEMTQRQLAESIGVSDKTISKWECGNGLPELSTIPELCKVLNINMNELLSGERLEEEIYSKKAEENMMTLMKETEEHKKKNKASLMALMICLSGVVAIMILGLSLGIGTSAFMTFLDIPSLIILILPMLLILVAAGLLKPFFKAFTMLKKTEQYVAQQVIKSKQALKLGMTSALTVGGLETLATIVLILGFYHAGMTADQLAANIAISMLTIVYGAVVFLLLLPIYYKLDVGQTE